MGTNYNPCVATDGLILYLDAFNSSSYAGTGTTWYDMISGKSYSLINTPVFDSTGPKCMNLNGSTQYLSGNISQLTFGTGDFAIQANIKLNGLSNGFTGAYAAAFVCAAGGGTGSCLLQIGGSSTAYTNIGVYHESSNIYSSINYNFSTNIIYNVAVTRSSGVMTVYINGAAIGSTAASNSYDFNKSGTLLGKHYFAGYEQYFKGNIYSLQAYSKNLSSTEVLQNFNATKKRYTPEENIARDGLVFHYDAGKTSSYSGIGVTIFDLSGIGNTGTLINGPTFSSLNGGSIVFDGSNDYFEAQHSSSLNISGSITVDVWVYMTSVSNSADMNLICKYSNAGGSSNQSWILFKSTGDYRSASPDGLTANNNEFVWLASSNGNYSGALIGTGEQVLTNTWYNVVAIYNSSTEKMQMYLNGQLKTNVTRTGQTSGVLSTNLRNLQIGGTPLDSNRWIQGRIPIARVYNRALTQQEISQNYNAVKNRYGLS
jgi:hypothetical protein